MGCTGFFLDKITIYERVKELFISEFQIEADAIGPEKCLEDDLDMDSLDMVDVIIWLKDDLNEKVDPALFKNARTVQDVVDLLEPHWKA